MSESTAEVHVGFEGMRIQGHRFAQNDRSLSEPAKFHQYAPEVAVIGSVRRLQPDCSADHHDSRFWVATLVFDHSETMQGPGMIRFSQ
jgi:hypothetical protein